MPLTITTAEARLRREVVAAELALDTAFACVAAVAQSIVVARADCDVPAHAGQRALLRLQSALTKLTGAQGDVFRAHDMMTRDGRAIMGPEEPYKPSYIPSGELPAVMPEEGEESITPLFQVA